MKIAQEDPFAEVRFTYAYQALIKAGIALLAKAGGVKVRSRSGHHIKIIDATAKILGDEDVALLGHALRKKRNLDLYAGGEFISQKEADDYLKFVTQTMSSITVLAKPNHRTRKRAETL